MVGISEGIYSKIWVEHKKKEGKIPDAIRIRRKCDTNKMSIEDYSYSVKKMVKQKKPTWKIKFRSNWKSGNSLDGPETPPDTVTIGEIPPDPPGNGGD